MVLFYTTTLCLGNYPTCMPYCNGITQTKGSNSSCDMNWFHIELITIYLGVLHLDHDEPLTTSVDPSCC